MFEYFKHRKGELLVPLLMFGYATYYYIEVKSLSRSDINLLLIGPVYWVMALAVVSYFVTSIIKFSLSRVSHQEKETMEGDGRKVTDKKATVLFLLLSCAYVFVIEWLGFVASSWLYMLLLLLAFSVKNKLVLLLLPLTTAGFIYLTFVLWLSIPLPSGWLK